MEDKATKPLIYETPAANLEEAPKKKNMMARIILPIFGLIILAEIIIGVRTLLSPIPTPAQNRIQPFSAAKMYLVPDKASANVGDSVNVVVRVSTGGHPTDGTDLSLKYDPTTLDTSASNFTPGNVYTDYPVVNFDTNNGLIKISGIASPNQEFSGLGNFGTIKFTLKKTGPTTLTLDYQGGVTSKSNVIETQTAKNLLDQGAELTLNSSSPQVGSVCSMRALQMCRDAQGRIGTTWCTSIQDPYSCSAGCFKDKVGTQIGCNVSSQ